jgi:hypothetical protein
MTFGQGWHPKKFEVDGVSKAAEFLIKDFFENIYLSPKKNNKPENPQKNVNSST